MTDQECGLPVDPIAQARAEDYITASIAYKLKLATRAYSATVTAVEVAVEDSDLSIRNVPRDVLDSLGAELRRVASLPRPAFLAS